MLEESSETSSPYASDPETPDFAFDPDDPWTQTFQEGLARADLKGKTVYEVGVGTGINVAFILQSCGARRVYGSDLDPRLVVLAERNIKILSPNMPNISNLSMAVSALLTPMRHAKNRNDRCGDCLHPTGRRAQ